MIEGCSHEDWRLCTTSDCPVIVMQKPMHGGLAFMTFDRPRDLLLLDPEMGPAVRFAAGTRVAFTHDKRQSDLLLTIQRTP